MRDQSLYLEVRGSRGGGKPATEEEIFLEENSKKNPYRDWQGKDSQIRCMWITKKTSVVIFSFPESPFLNLLRWYVLLTHTHKRIWKIHTWLRYNDFFGILLPGWKKKKILNLFQDFVNFKIAKFKKWLENMPHFPCKGEKRSTYICTSLCFFFFSPLERSCHFLTLHVEVNTVFPYHVLCSATPGMGLGVYSVTESDLFQFNCF